MNDKKIEVLKADSIFELVKEHRYGAKYTLHPMSEGEPSEIINCSEVEVADFISKMSKFMDDLILKVSYQVWEVKGGCQGDRLYPVKLTAFRFPGNSNLYLLILEGKDFEKKYIYEVV